LVLEIGYLKGGGQTKLSKGSSLKTCPHMGRSKDPGAEDPALVQPLEGALYDLADFNLLLE